MEAFLGLGLAEFAAPSDYRTSMFDPDLKKLLESHGVGPPVHQGHVVDGERILKRCVFEELAQDLARVEPCLDLDDDTGAVVAVGQIDGAGNPLQLVVLDPLADPFQDTFGADHEGELRDDDGLLPGGDVFNMGHRSGHEGAAALGIGLADPVASYYDTPAGKVGTGDITHQIIKAGVRVTHQVLGGRHDLAQVVGDHIGGHAHGDAGGPVDQEVGYGRGEDNRFLQLVVVVGAEVDGVLVNVGVHAQCGRGQACFGVSGGGRTIIQRSEVAMTINQGQTHGEGLGQTDHGLVDGGVAMGVELAHDLAHGTGGLHVGPVRGQVHLPHLIDDPALHRLEAVSGVGEGPGVDDGVGILQEGLAHLLVQRGLDDVFLDLPGVVPGSLAPALPCHAVCSPAS